ncbi:MAG: hypothetical protein HY301_14175 [Verrucomicrobia bacterium]|nr:hypothetical protein [Verrucomicrobiota bacterium]
MAFLWYLVSVPDLPHEVKDQFKAVEIVHYHTREKQMVDVGTPILRVKTWWALLDLVSTGKGQIEKNLFDNPAVRGCRVSIGHPLSLVFANADEQVYAKPPYCEVRVVEILKVKPQ